jgi:catechol-2,3-dioxygenase
MARPAGSAPAAADRLNRWPIRPPVTGISELVLVSDLEAARGFYRDKLGFEETLYGEGAEGRYWYLVGETARLGLWTEQVGRPARRTPRSSVIRSL